MSQDVTPLMTGTSRLVTHYDYVMNDGISFAELIRTAREAKGWSQEQLERATTDEHGEHVSVSTISRWERGQAGRPEPTHVRMVCKALDLDPRRAAISLGYLTHDEVFGKPEADPQDDLEEILAILRDPSISDEVKSEWKGYLRFRYSDLQDRARRQVG